VFRRVPFLDYFRNSILITLILCVIKILLGVISAYALSVLRFPGRNLVFLLVISALMVPSEVTVISNYALVSQLGWRDTYQGIIVPLAGIAFGTFLMRNHFMSIPSELIEAARMDHCGHVRLLWKVLLPISMPTLVAFSMITVVNEWNQYLWPFLMAETESSATLPIGLTMLQNNDGVSNWGPVMAATIMTMLPVLVLFLALQQYMIKGLISGAVKG
jgi:carbohydrate ABC transporter membrane protein 2, CUT1 family (TC 3.A.1.1.-)